MNTVRQYQRPLLIGIGAFVIALILWLAVISPEGNKVSTLQAQEASLQSQQQALQARLTALQSEGNRLAGNCTELQKIATEIPSVTSPADINSEESSFENQFNALATSTGVALVQFSGFAPAASSGSTTPSGSTTTSPAGVTAVPTTLTVSGNWGEVTGFINGLDSFPRLFVIQHFVMSYGASSTGASTGTATGTSPALWVGGQPNSPGTGPYNINITGSIFYTSAPNALEACAKATKPVR